MSCTLLRMNPRSIGWKVGSCLCNSCLEEPFWMCTGIHPRAVSRISLRVHLQKLISRQASFGIEKCCFFRYVGCSSFNLIFPFAFFLLLNIKRIYFLSFFSSEIVNYKLLAICQDGRLPIRFTQSFQRSILIDLIKKYIYYFQDLIHESLIIIISLHFII